MVNGKYQKHSGLNEQAEKVDRRTVKRSGEEFKNVNKWLRTEVRHGECSFGKVE